MPTDAELNAARGENPSYYFKDGDTYCTEPGHDTTPLDSRYGCRYCPEGD